MKIVINDYQVSLFDEPTYSTNSTDNIRSYNTELCRNDDYQHMSAHGIIVGDTDSPKASVILLGVGGATAIHADSITYYKQLCFVAAGDSVFALNIPTLEKNWIRKVDFATCFGVYWLEVEGCLITWGEVDICRFTSSGEKVWCASGADIFTEGFKIREKYIELTDFNNDKYLINIESGDINQITI